VVASIPFLYGCGSSDPAKTSAVGGIGSGSGIYGSGGCVPITSQIPFMAQGAQTQLWGSGQLAKVVAGTIPQATAGTLGILTQPGTYGSVAIGSISASGGNYLLSRPEATMQLAVNSPYNSNSGGYTQSSSTSTLTGFLQLTSLGIQNIVYKIQSGAVQIPGVTVTNPYQNTGYGYPNTGYPSTGYSTVNPAQICVSNLAFSLNASGGALGNGNLYLYLNNTSHGVVIDAL